MKFDWDVYETIRLTPPSEFLRYPAEKYECETCGWECTEEEWIAGHCHRCFKWCKNCGDSEAECLEFCAYCFAMLMCGGLEI